MRVEGLGLRAVPLLRGVWGSRLKAFRLGVEWRVITGTHLEITFRVGFRVWGLGIGVWV